MIDSVLENRFYETAVSFFTKKKSIDWEQRRYEIAKDVLCAKFTRGDSYDIDYAIRIADKLIAALKNS